MSPWTVYPIKYGCVWILFWLCYDDKVFSMDLYDIYEPEKLTRAFTH